MMNLSVSRLSWDSGIPRQQRQRKWKKKKNPTLRLRSRSQRSGSQFVISDLRTQSPSLRTDVPVGLSGAYLQKRDDTSTSCTSLEMVGWVFFPVGDRGLFECPGKAGKMHKSKLSLYFIIYSVGTYCHDEDEWFVPG